MKKLADINNDLFTAYLDTAKVNEMASAKIRDAIAAAVIANTAINSRVNESMFEILKAEAEKFAEASRIVLIRNGAIIKDICFIGSSQQLRKKLQQLMQLVNEYDVWYEDVCSASVKDDQFHGFCWGEEFFLGYPIVPAASDDDWDNEAVMPFNPKFAAAQQQLGEYESKWQQILRSKQGGNSVNIEDVKTLKKKIAELRDSTIYGEVRNGADKLMYAIEKWNIHN